MARNPVIVVRWVTLTAGILMLAYGLYALRSGSVLSTWARMEYRPSVPYWITTLVLIGLGAVNVAFGIRTFFRRP